MKRGYFFLVPTLALTLAIALGCTSQRSIPVLIVTDIGTDVDDAEAISLAVRSPRLEVIGVACTATDPCARAENARSLLSLLASRAPVGCSAQFIDSLISASPKKITVLLLAQATLLAEALEINPRLAKRLEHIYFQGQVFDDMRANPESFNVSEDAPAMERLLALIEHIPFTFIGKYAVYPLALSRETLDHYAQSGHPAGIYLKQAAVKSLHHFAFSSPEVFRKVYSIDSQINLTDSLTIEQTLQSLSKLSNPYDAVTVLALTHPQYFQPRTIHNRHRLIGMNSNESGIKDPAAKDSLTAILYHLFDN